MTPLFFVDAFSSVEAGGGSSVPTLGGAGGESKPRKISVRLGWPLSFKMLVIASTS